MSLYHEGQFQGYVQGGGAEVIRLSDRRGGNHIHSWELNLFGETTEEERCLLDWMVCACRQERYRTAPHRDRSPIPLDRLETDYPGELPDLAPLVRMGYLNETDAGYIIGRGQLSFEINTLVFGGDVCPTITATDIRTYGVVGSR